MARMPVIFVGHGSPMNAIEENPYTRSWRQMADRIPSPQAILSISAHWYTRGTRIQNGDDPKTIHDMVGFPRALYEIQYEPGGSPAMAEKVKELISRETRFDNSWGIDHGTWSVLVHMYPQRDIPVFQVSIDASAPPGAHYKMGQELRSLRRQGVLLFASGNIVHNLRMVDWKMAGQGFDWAHAFDDYIYDRIMARRPEDILAFKEKGELARLAVPTPDHFYPLLYALGASEEDDVVKVFNRTADMGSLTMTSYLWE